MIEFAWNLLPEELAHAVQAAAVEDVGSAERARYFVFYDGFKTVVLGSLPFALVVLFCTRDSAPDVFETLRFTRDPGSKPYVLDNSFFYDGFQNRGF